MRELGVGIPRAKLFFVKKNRVHALKKIGFTGGATSLCGTRISVERDVKSGIYPRVQSNVFTILVYRMAFQ